MVRLSAAQPTTRWTSQTITRTLKRSLGTAAMLVGLLASPSLAKDPFRTGSAAKPIDDQTEAAFLSVFKKGDYVSAKADLAKAPASEPLAAALKAAIAYTYWAGEQNPQTKQALLDEFSTYATQTKQVAQQSTDPLRSNLYKAVGNFLEGAYMVGKDGVVRGTAGALGKLQQAFQNLDAAEKIDPNDPELNLVKGYIDLLLSVTVNLPLSSPADAINRLETKAQPAYLSQRGLAIGYRDLKQYDKALQAVDQAIQAAPTNPDLKYLKGQILYRQGKRADSVALFQEALKDAKQLPPSQVSQIQRELRVAQGQ
ncbi:Sll0314/Alr1548 family TPR repeat-containing protein [Myxacorys almedinensis]|uniref:Tetratricopeptide repeat protein n=1 Tax=Myxacorys almedinensis A TaxID=2690445 RepID=A0A8J8CI55_9CYAN|nr:Sll0314/Alr1548 family TPR repeat-containing protein [Myxacorys almedinensis]NDJ16131.1 tetratricopeptide repeat protein [Myxacorys almedinensis A]